MTLWLNCCRCWLDKSSMPRAIDYHGRPTSPPPHRALSADCLTQMRSLAAFFLHASILRAHFLHYMHVLCALDYHFHYTMAWLFLPRTVQTLSVSAATYPLAGGCAFSYVRGCAILLIFTAPLCNCTAHSFVFFCTAPIIVIAHLGSWPSFLVPNNEEWR